MAFFRAKMQQGALTATAARAEPPEADIVESWGIAHLPAELRGALSHYNGRAKREANIEASQPMLFLRTLRQAPGLDARRVAGCRCRTVSQVQARESQVGRGHPEEQKVARHAGRLRPRNRSGVGYRGHRDGAVVDRKSTRLNSSHG